MLSPEDIPAGIDLCEIPVGFHPEGKESNFDDPPSLAPAILTVMSIMLAWSVICTSIRLYTNIKRFQWADCFNVLALVMAVGLLAYQATQTHLLRHMWDIRACWMANTMNAKRIFIPSLLVQLGACFAKASILFLYGQLFSSVKRTNMAIWAGQAVNLLLYAAGIGVDAYYQTPRPGEPWEAVLDGRTVKPFRWWQAQASVVIALDIYIFVLPLPIVTKLNLTSRRRMQLIAVFSLASLGIGASIASLVARVELTKSKDLTWMSALLSLCSFVELTVAIIVCSAPAFSNFVRSHLLDLSMFRNILTSISSSSSRLRRGSATEVQYGFNSEGASARVQAAKQSTSSTNMDLYGPEDARIVRAWTSVDNGSQATEVQNECADHGIVRTVDFEQTVGATGNGREKLN